MNEHLLVVTDSLVTFGRVLPATVIEEASTDSFPNLGEVFGMVGAARHNGQAESFHDLDQLLSDVLATLHGASLDKVLVAPLVLESVHFPGLVHRQHRQVITILVVELCPFLVGQLLLLTWAIEDILDGEHRHDRDDLLGASQIDRGQHHLRKLRLEWELRHQSSDLGQ